MVESVKHPFVGFEVGEKILGPELVQHTKQLIKKKKGMKEFNCSSR